MSDMPDGRPEHDPNGHDVADHHELPPAAPLPFELEPELAVAPPEPPPPVEERFKVQIQAYARLSFNDELEVDGMIGPVFFEIASKSGFRKLTAEGTVYGWTNRIRYKLQRFRGFPVTGEVLGQAVTGHVTRKEGVVYFDGVAGQEPLHYTLNPAGSVTKNDIDIGLSLVYQSFYSEVSGEVERGVDALMVAFLLPIMHYKPEVTAVT